MELELILLIRDGVGVEFNRSRSWHFFPTPIDLMTSKRTTKKLHRCPQRWATPTPELELTLELTLFYSELELVLLTLELELEWSFENIDGVGVELELKFLIRYGVGVQRSAPSRVVPRYSARLRYIAWTCMERVFFHLNL